MKQYIDKAKVVAEIERLKECNRKICGGDFDFLKKAYPKHYYSTEIYNDILSFLDTLEVKEVDLEKKIENYIYTLPYSKTGIPGGWKHSWPREYVEKIAEHFFELGLKIQKGDKL